MNRFQQGLIRDDFTSSSAFTRYQEEEFARKTGNPLPKPKRIYQMEKMELLESHHDLEAEIKHIKAKVNGTIAYTAHLPGLAEGDLLKVADYLAAGQADAPDRNTVIDSIRPDHHYFPDRGLANQRVDPDAQDIPDADVYYTSFGRRDPITNAVVTKWTRLLRTPVGTILEYNALLASLILKYFRGEDLPERQVETLHGFELLQLVRIHIVLICRREGSSLTTAFSALYAMEITTGTLLLDQVRQAHALAHGIIIYNGTGFFAAFVPPNLRNELLRAWQHKMLGFILVHGPRDTIGRGLQLAIDHDRPLPSVFMPAAAELPRTAHDVITAAMLRASEPQEVETVNLASTGREFAGLAATIGRGLRAIGMPPEETGGMYSSPPYNPSRPPREQRLQDQVPRAPVTRERDGGYTPRERDGGYYPTRERDGGPGPSECDRRAAERQRLRASMERGAPASSRPSSRNHRAMAATRAQSDDDDDDDDTDGEYHGLDHPATPTHRANVASGPKRWIRVPDPFQ